MKKLKNNQIAADLQPLIKIDDDCDLQDQFANTSELKGYQQDIEEMYNLLL